MRRACQLNLLQGLVVSQEHSFRLVALGIEDIAIESKAVRSNCVWTVRKQSPETVEWKHLVCVVVLDDLHHCLDGLDVLVGLLDRIKVVKRVRLVDLAVRQRVVNCDMDTDFAPSEDVV